jgi:hypothetical protein
MRHNTSNHLEELTIDQIADQLERRFLTLWKEKFPAGNGLTIEVVKDSLRVHYGPPGHRVRMTRAEAIRFLDVTAQSVRGEAVQAGEATHEPATPPRKKPNLSDQERERRAERMRDFWRKKRREAAATVAAAASAGTPAESSDG